MWEEVQWSTIGKAPLNQEAAGIIVSVSGNELLISTHTHTTSLWYSLHASILVPGVQYSINPNILNF